MPRVRTNEAHVPARPVSSVFAAIVCVFIFLPQPRARGHGSDFLFAKVIIGDGDVRLEITADCEGNALIPDRGFAAAALPMALQLQLGDDRKSLSELADISLEDRSQFDESVPLPPGTLDNSISHQLLTALWRWKPDRDAIRFTVPKGSRLDVLLWVTDTRRPAAEPQWMVLLGGDVSPPIALPHKTPPPSVERSGWMKPGIVAMMIAAAAGLVHHFRRRR